MGTGGRTDRWCLWDWVLPLLHVRAWGVAWADALRNLGEAFASLGLRLRLILRGRILVALDGAVHLGRRLRGREWEPGASRGRGRCRRRSVWRRSWSRATGGSHIVERAGGLERRWRRTSRIRPRSLVRGGLRGVYVGRRLLVLELELVLRRSVLLLELRVLEVVRMGGILLRRRLARRWLRRRASVIAI